MKLTDKELLHELEQRFHQRDEMIDEQKKLLSDLENVNKKLLESEQLKSHFLSNIKNEINNPITSMMGLLKMIYKNPGDADKNANLAQLVYKEAFTLNFHLQNVFHAAELEAGHAVPEYSRVKINDLIKGISEAHSEIFKEKNIEISYEFKGQEEFTSDRTKLEIVFSNLISNALKFSHENDKIMIETKKGKEGALTVFVHDYGIGITAGDTERIFDRFVQLDSGTRKHYGGHGLGLSVTQSIVDLLGGSIILTSDEGKGTVFKVLLPEGEVHPESDLFDEEDEFLFSDDDNVDIF